MNLNKLKKMLTDAGIDNQEAKYELKMLLEHFCNYTELDKLKGNTITDSQVTVIEEKIKERITKHIPIQYITGKAWFMNNFFKVTPEVLIPRDETELLVLRAIEIINNEKFKDVLDIGTGSGCIACTIAKHTPATVLGTDISSNALRIALDNVTKLNLNNKAIFRKSNLFEKIRDGESFDLIISNPPYIPTNTILSKEVMQEPSIALFAEDDGLYFYKKITEEAPTYLNANGYLMFELGINQAKRVKDFMSKDFCQITIEKDLAGIDRIIYGKLKI